MAITLTDYSDHWPGMFMVARAELARSLDSTWLVAIEHIGSTAVPGLAAKSVIDILAGVWSLGRIVPHERPIAELGYSPWFDGPSRVSFERRDSTGQATHHLHVVVHGGPVWRDQLAFRDSLRAAPEERSAYEVLKRDLAARYSDTRDYSRGKDGFVRAVLSRASRGA